MTEERGEKKIFNALSKSESFFGLCATLSMIEHEWESIAGAALAKRSGPKAYEDGVLVVGVENRSAEQDMNFRKGAIIKEIRSKMSLRLKDIRTEICRVKRRRVSVVVSASRWRKPPAVPEGPELEALVCDMMERNPKLKPGIARAAARCRIARAKRGV
ncbi:MAG: DUF721 domain-containing protein [Synergistaceae bacterium]|jgi:hypothetical protein|nr:DUF721 domain-containing protein [Synergistaceae bacterium]